MEAFLIASHLALGIQPLINRPALELIHYLDQIIPGVTTIVCLDLGSNSGLEIMEVYLEIKLDLGIEIHFDLIKEY